MAVLQDININVHGQPSEKRLQTFLRLSQNENGRMINFRVLGAPLPSNCTATFSGTKPDGNVYSKTGTVAGNFVVIQEDMQMTAVAGVWDAKLDIINGTHNIMTALIRVVVDADVVDPDAIASDSQLQGLVAEAKYYAEHARTDAYGSPLTATTAAEMTDKTRAYVYTGSETGMTAGNWYYWNGSAWEDGGVYNAVAVETDTSLSIQGRAADAKKTGDEISSLKEDLTSIENMVETTVNNKILGTSLDWDTGYISVDNEAKGTTTTYRYSEDIEVIGGTNVVYENLQTVMTGYLLIACYDAEKNYLKNDSLAFISGGMQSGTFALGNNVAYIKICTIFNSNVEGQNKSAVTIAQKYSAIAQKLDKPEIAGTAGQVLASDGNDGTYWKDESFTGEEAAKIVDAVSQIQYQKQVEIVGTDIEWEDGTLKTDGTVTESTTYHYSELIDVVGGTDVEYEALQGAMVGCLLIACYDKNGTYLADKSLAFYEGGQVDGEFGLDDSVAKIRICSAFDSAVPASNHAKVTVYQYASRIDDLRDDIEEIIANLKDVVDWSDASSLRIDEPRCAVINITGVDSMPTTKVQDDHAYIEFWDMQGNYFKKRIILNAQGASSMMFPKKNLSIDLCNDNWVGSDTFKIRFGDWVEQDSFHCKAYYTDFFKGVCVLSYQVWNLFGKTNGIFEDRTWKKALIPESMRNTVAVGFGGVNDITLQTDTGARGFPDGFPCIVYLNGSFYGVYSWQLKKHRDNMHMDKNTAGNIHLDGVISKNTLIGGTIDWSQCEIRNPKSLYCMDGTKYEGDTNQGELIDSTSANYDSSNANHVRSATVKGYIETLSGVIPDLIDLVDAYEADQTQANLDAIKDLYETYFDVDNQIDYLIFSDISYNSDGFQKNWQWITYDGTKWFIELYDADCTFGGHWNGQQTQKNLNNHVNNDINYPSYYVIRFYTDRLEARYAELRTLKVIDADNIIEMMKRWMWRIGTDMYKKEYKKWTNAPCNGDNVIDTDHWELVPNDTSQSNTYNNATTYAVNDTCYYGLATVGVYYKFKCIAPVTGSAPITEFRYRDSLYRFASWTTQEIINMDALYHFGT